MYGCEQRCYILRGSKLGAHLIYRKKQEEIKAIQNPFLLTTICPQNLRKYEKLTFIRGKRKWATDGARTRNSQNHNLELYH